jgi:hypothetical protein
MHTTDSAQAGQHTPRFAVGDRVRIPTSTPGHDRHRPKDAFRVTDVFTGTEARTTHYKLQGDPSLWPETRLV